MSDEKSVRDSGEGPTGDMIGCECGVHVTRLQANRRERASLFRGTACPRRLWAAWRVVQIADVRRTR